MVGFSFEANIKALENALTDLERRQLPFAVAMALNDTAKDVKEARKRAMVRQLDRPTPFTLNGQYITRARKSHLVAEIGPKDIQATYLQHQIKGGTRLPKKRAIVTPVAQRTNKYGNMTRGAVRRVKAKKNVFSGKVNGTPGLWQRFKRRGPKLLIAYIGRAQYQRRLNLERPSKIAAQVKWNGHMRRRLARALATAR